MTSSTSSVAAPSTAASTVVPVSSASSSSSSTTAAQGLGGFFSRFFGSSGTSASSSGSSVSSSSSSSSNSSTSGSSSTTAATTIDKVIVASAALTGKDQDGCKLANERLWKVNVSDKSMFNLVGRLIGLISYAINKNSESDVTAAAKDLVHALQRRDLTVEEARKANSSPVAFTNNAARDADIRKQDYANEKLADFYTIFKARVTKLGKNENSVDFKDFVAAAQLLVKDSNNDRLMAFKTETANKQFGEKLYNDIVTSFASKNLEEIRAGYKGTVATLAALFPNNQVISMETAIRQAIKAQHTNAAEFTDLSNAYGDASATAPKFVAIRQNLEVTSTAKKADLEAKLAALRGTTGFNGTIHTAYVAKEAARTALEASVASLRVMFLDLSRGTDVAAIAELLARDTNSPAIATAKALVQANLDAFKAADKAFTDIVAELAKIAVYNAAGNVVGGELAAVNANLNPAALDAAARSEATKIARFFAEINKEIGDNNQVVLFNQLHAVI